jgi:hypothetical protein
VPFPKPALFNQECKFDEMFIFPDFRRPSAAHHGSSASALPNRPPSLGHVVLALNHLGNKLISAHTAREELTQKLLYIDQLSSQVRNMTMSVPCCH